MISNEASASELAISSAITPAPLRFASADAIRVPAAPQVRAPAPAKRPPTLPEARALRSRRWRTANHIFPPCRRSGPGPYFSTHVYHILLSSANVKVPLKHALHCRSEVGCNGSADKLVRVRNDMPA